MEIIELTVDTLETYLSDCLEVQQELVREGTTIDANQFRLTAGDTHSFFIGVIEDAHLVGMGVVSKMIDPIHTTGYVNNIVVSDSYRGRGYFTSIMEKLEGKAKEWSCTHIALTCSREAVQPLYIKRGYAKKETNYYSLDLV